MEVLIRKFPEALVYPAEIEATVKTAAEKVGEMYGVAMGEVSVTLTDDAYIKTLNRQYRQMDRPTDVLSFALNEGDEPAITGGLEINVLGDIVLSVERAKAQAEAGDRFFDGTRDAAFIGV